MRLRNSWLLLILFALAALVLIMTHRVSNFRFPAGWLRDYGDVFDWLVPPVWLGADEGADSAVQQSLADYTFSNSNRVLVVLKTKTGKRLAAAQESGDSDLVLRTTNNTNWTDTLQEIWAIELGSGANQRYSIRNAADPGKYISFDYDQECNTLSLVNPRRSMWLIETLPGNTSEFRIKSPKCTNATESVSYYLGTNSNGNEVRMRHPNAKTNDPDSVVWTLVKVIGPASSNPAATQLPTPTAAAGTYVTLTNGSRMPATIMEATGGNWILVMNYVRPANSNPALNVREPQDGLPTLSSTAQYNFATMTITDESGTARWGHASPSLLSLIDFNEVRFQGRSDGTHTRKLDFVTSNQGVISYIKTGAGSMNGIQTSSTGIQPHNGILPAQADAFNEDKGSYALTDLPFQKAGPSGVRWGLRPRTANGIWEMDENNASGGSGTRTGTIHRVWVRKRTT